VSGQLPDGLPPEWEALAREDAEALAPPHGAKERVQRRVAFTLGLGAGFIAATAVTSTAAAAGVASAASGAGTGGSAATGLAGALLAKKAIVLGLAAAVTVGGGTAAVLEVRSERARSRAAALAPPTRAPIARPPALPSPEPSAAESAPPEPAPEQSAPDTLGEERALLDRARQDIASGKLVAARSLLSRHSAQFPAGHLAEEREALVIRLLVREGRVAEARAHAARFRKAHPRSIQLPGIADALGERR
jgi:hypothetical protein